jgi:formylglycine-generating enzyme required for sulfatase activity
LGLLVGILALTGVFSGRPSPAAEEEPESEEAAAPVEEEVVPAAEEELPAVTANDQWTPVIQEFDGVEMALVPTGCFMMGSEDGEDNERPIHEQCFDEPFWIDVTEVTNRQFAAFLNEAGNQIEGGATWFDASASDERIRQSGQTWSALDGFANHPAAEVTWFGAEAYCEGRRARLPTEAEWEYAARGPDGLTYPWGSSFDGNLANFCDINCANTWRDADINDGYETTSPVGSYPDGASWVGAMDMSGNVWEWVNSIREPYPYDGNDGREVDGSGDDSSSRVMRGGSWDNHPDFLRAAIRDSGIPIDTNLNFAFRCARDY